MAGLTRAGFEAKRGEDIRADINARLIAAFGNSWVTSSDSKNGELIDPFVQELQLVWQQMQNAYNAFSDDATGVNLDNRGSFLGVRREGGQLSTGEVRFTGTNGTVIFSGTIVRVSTTDTRFRTTDPVTISGGTATVAIEGIEEGPLTAAAGEIDELVNPIAGVTAVTNDEDVTPGRVVESDFDYFVRQELSTQANTGATDPALRARLLALDDVDEAFVISNRSDSVDANGVPAHATWIIVYPNTADQDQVARTIYEHLANGSLAYGTSVTKTVTDSQGNPQTYSFDFATERDVWITANLTVDEDYPAGGDDLVAAALLAQGGLQRIGEDIKQWEYIKAPGGIPILQIDEIPGIVDIEVLLGFSSPPAVDGNLSIAFNERGIIDSGRITVNSV